MALPITVDSLDSIDESARAFYIEADGKYRLDVEGLEDTSGLKSALEKERAASKDAKRKLTEAEQFKQQFEGLDIEAVKGLLNKASQDEETKLIAEGKLDQVFERRTERLRGEQNKAIKAEQDARAKAESRAKALEVRALGDVIRGAAIEAGAEKGALDDFILRGTSIWSLDENGKAVAQQDGEIIYGKDGKTPLAPKEWAESLRESAPHLFPRVQGAGAPGGGKAGAKTITRTAFDALPHADKQRVATGGYTITD